MNIIQYAHKVDFTITALSNRQRSDFSQAQKDVADQMIADHAKAGSDPIEAATLIWAAIKSVD